MVKRKFSKETLESILIDTIEIYDGDMEDKIKLVDAIDKVYTLYEQEIDTLDLETTFIK